MDRDTLGNILFLASLAGSSFGCASGSEGSGPRPGPFVTGGDDSGPQDPWTDPLETTGSAPTTGDAEPSGDTEGDWPSEGETGQLSSDTGDLPPPDDSGAGMEETGSTGLPDAGESSGGYVDETTGPVDPVGDGPCPSLAQLYASCSPDYFYESEIDLCNQAQASAYGVSGGCGFAHAEYLACLSTLNCGALLQPSVPLECLLQSAAMDLACL